MGSVCDESPGGNASVPDHTDIVTRVDVLFKQVFFSLAQVQRSNKI